MVSGYFVNVFRNTSPLFKANYIVARIEASGHSDSGKIYSRALRYPICGRTVFEMICRLLKDYKHSSKSTIQLPRRLFRSLLPANGRQWSDQDHPLPFLRDLYATPNLPAIDVNAYNGYALTKAVHGQFTALVRYLLDKGASSKYRDGIAVKIAIRLKDLDMFKMLVEWPRPDMNPRDRKIAESTMGLAMLSGATDIVEFYRRKGIVPNIVALRKLVIYYVSLICFVF
jgi:hypothetical protein